MLKNGKLVFQNPKAYADFLSVLQEGTILDLQIKKARNTRTNPQNSYLWGIVYPYLLEGFKQAGYVDVDIEVVHAFCKNQFNAGCIPNMETGEVLTYARSTTELDTKEFGEYVDKIRHFALHDLGIIIPEPESVTVIT